MPLADTGITIRLSDCYYPNRWISNMRAITKKYQFLGRPASPEGESSMTSNDARILIRFNSVPYNNQERRLSDDFD
jgi:hypothetical protein